MLIHVTDLAQPGDEEGIQELWFDGVTYPMRWNENGNPHKPSVSVWMGEDRYTCVMTSDINFGWTQEDMLSGLPMLAPGRAAFWCPQGEAVWLCYRVGSTRLYAWTVTGLDDGARAGTAVAAVEKMYGDDMDRANIDMLAGLQGITVSTP